jgi:3-oxoacyl-[acyl-carrier-protein] synthase III
MGAKLTQIGVYLPEKTLSNDELAEQFPEWSAGKIGEKIGISVRHVAARDETALDMAVNACEMILTTEHKNRVDFILLCTQSPDYFLPTSACIMQERLGLRTDIGALDFNLGCSGFIYGLALSKGLIASGIANSVLLVMSETYSKHIHQADKSNRSIFGDAAAAVVIERSTREHIGEFVLGTDGRGKDNLIVHNGGMRNRQIDTGNKPDPFLAYGINPNCLYMNGPEIFNFTIQSVPPLVTETLARNRTTIDAIDYVIFHQANKFMLDYLRKKIKIPDNKFFIDMEETGNTVSATIPIALGSAIKNNLIKTGDKILLAGFGVGYSWGAVVIEI